MTVVLCVQKNKYIMVIDQAVVMPSITIFFLFVVHMVLT